jgi:dihydroorotate dehydrogenase
MFNLARKLSRPNLSRAFNGSSTQSPRLITLPGVIFCGSIVGGCFSYLFSDQIRQSAFYLNLSDVIVVPLVRKLMDAEDAHDYTIMAAKWNLTPIEKLRPLKANEITNNLYKKKRLLAKEQANKKQQKVSTTTIHPSSTSERLESNVWGLHFSSPVGMAAGFDKNAEVIGQLLDMGFGFVEVGGVTPLPQEGNPKPRSFRLTEDQAIINRYGLNSDGALVVRERLAQFKQGEHSRRKKGVLGVNLAKNTNSTSSEEDYIEGLTILGNEVDFIVMNISCPNVSWTSKLKESDVRNLIVAVKNARDQHCSKTPILLKIGPDYDQSKMKSLAKIALETKVDGLVVSNTSTSRPATLTSRHASEKGGLSGQPIKERAHATLHTMYKLTNGKIPIIGVGGIANGEDAYARIKAGASLVQVYTAMTYAGPGLIQEIKRDIDSFLIRDGFSNISEAIGVDHQD